MEARLLSAILGVAMVQVQTAVQDLDLQKVASLPCLREAGQGGPSGQLHQCPVTPTLSRCWSSSLGASGPPMSAPSGRRLRV